MKRWIPWMAAAIVIVLLGGGVWRALASRQAQQKALAEAATQRAEAPLQLAADEVLRVQRRELVLGVPVSGALRAVDSAMVKARAAGELQGLTVREGDRVKAGQEIARIDPTEARARVRQAQQQADAAKAQVDINQRQYDNNRALVAQGFISSTALVLVAAVWGKVDVGDTVVAQTLLRARKALDDTVVKSPISGLVAQRLAQPGERVAVDARIVEVVDLTRLELEAQLPPADALAVRVGQKALLTVEGLAEPVPATVARITPSAQAGSRTVPVYLRVDARPAAAPRLRQGLFVQGLLTTGSAQVLTVPLDAVRTDKPAPYLQTIKDGRVAYAPVQTGARAVVNGQTLVAVDGVPVGTTVIAGRMGSLREGTPVTAAQAAVMPQASAPAPAQAASRTAP